MKTVLITGCTSGFGKRLVSAFLKNGDKVIATGRSLTTRKEIFADERAQYNEQLQEFDLDVTIPAQRASLLKSLTKLDILINNAGFGLFGALEDIEEKQVRDQMEANFFGTVFMTQDFLPLLRASNGKIFNFSSGFGLVGFPMTSIYCASKFAVEGFSEALSHEVAPFGVQVCLIEPGAYRTGFGSKAMWGHKSDNKQSPYALQTFNYKKLQTHMTTRKNFQDPEDVVKKVFQLAHQSQIPLRVRCGKDVNATHWMKRLTPSQAFQSMSRRMYKKLFLKEMI
jgi:NAD(P)-dependent dehydrogenase (short-subunit alcohol dehydrogenase family)